MTEETKALTVVGSGTLTAPTAHLFVQQASQMAGALAQVIEKQELYKVIGNKKHVYVEGWTTLAAMLGMTPREVSTIDTDGVYVATVELVNAQDRVIGRASAECGAEDEFDNQGNLTWAERPAYARRSMAQTRATSKVCRLALSWIMTLAGFAGTPAEEMDSVQPASAASKGPWDGSMLVKFGKFKGKKFSELPNDYIAWAIENMKPPIQDYIKLEAKRRLAAETVAPPEPETVDAEPVEQGLFP